MLLPADLLPTSASWRSLRSVQCFVVSTRLPWLATVRADALLSSKSRSPGFARLNLASPSGFAPPPCLPALVRLHAFFAFVFLQSIFSLRLLSPCSLLRFGSVRRRLQPLAALGSSVRRYLPSLRRSHRAASLNMIHKAAAILPCLDGWSVWLYRRFISLSSAKSRFAKNLRLFISYQLSAINKRTSHESNRCW